MNQINRRARISPSVFGAALIGLTSILVPTVCPSATWQYVVPFETDRTNRDGTPREGSVFLWLPPQSRTIRGLLVGGRLGIEIELALDSSVRKACAESDLGIVYFSPHISGVFHYWEDGNTDEKRWLKAFDDLARRSGHPELQRVPWITMGHSTAGIFCRNVAYRWPNRVAGILHIKSGNFHQKQHLPPSGSLAGVPLVAINGQFEVYGPEGGIRPEYGRETQWIFVRQNIHTFKDEDPSHLMSIWLDLGGDHFHGSPELAEYAALFIRKTANYRIAETLPPGDEAVACTPLALEDGWLSDPDLYNPEHKLAPYDDYTGDKSKAMWHYDREIAEATAQHHRNLGHHQALSGPVSTWLDKGDGWTFRVAAEFLDTMPESYGGKVGGEKVGHAATPVLYRCKINEAVERIGPDTFRVLRPTRSVNIAAVNLGDDRYRGTNRWSRISVPNVKGEKQTIEFPPIPDLKADSAPITLGAAASSKLPIYYEVEYGPVDLKGEQLIVSELPVNAQFPIECKVTAYQIGRRTEPQFAPAPAASQIFKVIKTLPAGNPVASHYKNKPGVVPDWVDSLPWDRVVSIEQYEGESIDERLAAAQAAVAKEGGGVVRFPAGVYRFQDHIELCAGVILCGADPSDQSDESDRSDAVDAKNATYRLPTRFEFPKYEPSMEGEGTPIDTAFKSIRLDPKASRAGVVNIAINRGDIYFPEEENHQTGGERIVFGCILTNTAAADPNVPNPDYGHKPHQRWTHRHRAAIHVYGENLFVANNRVPQSGDDNFVVTNYSLIEPNHSQGYKLGQPNRGVVTIEDGVVFDYDNRPGIYVNLFSIPKGVTPESTPWYFRKGSVIRDNYIYCSGRSAITYTGDGTVCSHNVIRFPEDVWRPTCTGLVTSDGSSTNDNRAVTMRGYRHRVEGNDYIVHSNRAYNKKIRINDGEGIMHEEWANSPLKDSRIIDNRGNRYVCIWVVDVDGLLIEGNHLGDTGDPAIHILGSNQTVRNVRILNNEIEVGFIRVVAGKPENIEIRGNRFVGDGEGRIIVNDPAWASDNAGFVVEKYVPRAKRKRK